MRGNKLGRLLRVARVYAGKSQTEVADRVPMAVSTLSDIERGQSEPTLQVIAAILSYLGGAKVLELLGVDVERLKEINEIAQSTNQLLYA